MTTNDTELFTRQSTIIKLMKSTI
jgi:hypothetical protein